MQLQLLKTYAESIELRDATKEEIKEGDVKLLFNASLNEGDLKLFRIQFDIQLIVDNDKYLKLVHSSILEANEDLSEAFMETSLCKVNAPAVAFPFLRSYIAQITLLSGFDPVILPTRKFSA